MWEDVTAIKQILVFVFTGLNVVLNIGMLYYLYRAWKELREHGVTHDVIADVLARIDKIAIENANGLVDTLQQCVNVVLDKIDLIHKRQNPTA